MNNSNQSDKNVPVYRRNGSGNSKARKATKREQEEALKWGKFGMAMMMGFMPGPKVKRHANGGVVNGTTLSYVGEDGPEAIIPLGSKRRQRGMDLWNQVLENAGIEVAAARIGELLTVQEQAGFQMILGLLDDDHIDYLNNKMSNAPYWTTIGK